MSTDANQNRIDELFDQAIALPANEREAFLGAACNGDAEVLAAIKKLVAAHERTTAFIAPPPSDECLFRDTDPLHRPLIGQRIGPYEVKRWLGGGGFGHVYLAFRSDDYKQKVAIKVLRSDIEVDDRILARFELERQLLADLQHEHIARLLYGGTLESGRPYIVMEYVKGKPITEYCDANRLPLKERLAIFRQVCEAVAYAHRYGAIHRDIKPGNIFVAENGEVKLLDFGIAKMVDPISQRRMVTISEGGMPLTPEYASPEQVRGEGISTASDVYSLGVVLYELLTGRRPYEFRRFTPAEFERVICEEEPRKPSTIVLEPVHIRRSDGTEDVCSAETLAEPRSTDSKNLNRLLKGDLEQIVLMSLRKEPRRRYATVEALVDDLDRADRGETIVARPISRAERGWRWVRRNKMIAALSCATVLLLIAGTTISIALSLKANERARDAESERARAISSLRKARKAVEDSFTSVSESKLLNTPGLQPFRAELLEAAAKYYQEFTNDWTDDADLEADLASSFMQLAEMKRELGDHDSADRLHRKSIDKMEALIRRDPNNATYQGNLAAFLVNFYQLTSSISESEKEPYLKRAIAILEKLSRENPTNPEYARYLSGALCSFGATCSVTGRAADAEINLKRAIKIQERLVHDNPDDSKCPGILVSSYTILGNFQTKMGHFADGEGNLTRAFQLQSQVVKNNPSSLEDQSLLAMACDNLGDVQIHKGRFVAAEKFCKQAIEIEERLTNSNPEVAAYRRFLATYYGRLGQLYYDTKRYDDAALYFNREIEILEKLADYGDRFPFLVSAYYALAEIQRATSHGEKAEENFKKAVEIYEKLVRKEPAALGKLRDLAAATVSLAQLQASNNRADAKTSYSRAIDIYTQLAKVNSADPQNLEQLSMQYINLGDFLRHNDDSSGARQNYQLAVTVLTDHIKNFSALRDYRLQLARAKAAQYALLNKKPYLDPPISVLRKKLQGKSTVEFEVAAVSGTSDVIVLNSMRDYHNPECFSAAVSYDQAALLEGSIIEHVDDFLGRRIRVTGTVRERNGGVCIAIDDASSQLEVRTASGQWIRQVSKNASKLPANEFIDPPISQLRARVGQETKVRFRVQAVGGQDYAYLNSKRNYYDSECFTAVVEFRKALAAIGVNDAQAELVGRTVCVTGTIEDRNGAIQIRITDVAKQLQIVDRPNAPPPASEKNKESPASHSQ